MWITVIDYVIFMLYSLLNNYFTNKKSRYEKTYFCHYFSSNAIQFYVG